MTKLDKYRAQERATALALVSRDILADYIHAARAYGLRGMACGFRGARAVRAVVRS